MKTPERWSDLIKGTLRVYSLGHRNWGPRNNPYSTMPQTVLTELHCSSTSSLTALTSDSSWNWTLASRALMVDTTPLATTERVLVSEMQHVPPVCPCCVFRFDVKKVSVKASGRWPCAGSLWKKGNFGNHTVKVATTATVCVCVSLGCLSEIGSGAGAVSNMLALNLKHKRFRLM